MDITPLLKLMTEKNASDLFFTPKAPVKIKIEGQIMSLGKEDLSTEQVKAAAHGVMTEEQIAYLEKELEIDFAISRQGLGRFRANVFYQRGNLAMVLRFVTLDVPRLEEINVPEILVKLSMDKRGLVLMVGATGSGKSTTIAAMINHRNENTANHIVTIEEPIEFLHPNKKSIVNQRELGLDTRSYARALKSAMREAPDVVVIGEIRDRETMQAAVTLAGTGHLCIATLHANNAAETLDRIINMFPQAQQRQIFMDLSHYLNAIVAQRLVIGRDRKRVPAVEVLLNTPHVADLTMKGDVTGVKEALRESMEAGMQSFDASLYQLYKDGNIDLETALANADSATDLEAKINFG
ncbi:MAG: PilT/PilU family type 4a pilus ATPase [Gammaproteobacteria bacterium]|jgi:twitching motility protein PilU|nr:MAG: twitching motility protein PilT [Gammaproteobacteria bacterium SG8_31]